MLYSGTHANGGRGGASLVRLVTGFDTRPEDVDALLAAARRHAAAATESPPGS